MDSIRLDSVFQRLPQMRSAASPVHDHRLPDGLIVDARPVNGAVLPISLDACLQRTNAMPAVIAGDRDKLG